jgi:hypothetical protein
MVGLIYCLYEGDSGRNYCVMKCVMGSLSSVYCVVILLRFVGVSDV